MILSIIIPVYNEGATIAEILRRISEVQLDDINFELIIVDDGSTDNSKDILEELKNLYSFRLINHKTNKGKGAAIRSALKLATGEYSLIQDADLEYNPRDYATLIEPVLHEKADVVYGSRFRGSKPHRILFFWHSIGNRMLTFISNALNNLNLSDMETGYKLIKTSILKEIRLQEKRFGIEPEITAKIAKIPDILIYEVGISYYGRTYEEGKKIKLKDAFRAIYCIFKYSI